MNRIEDLKFTKSTRKYAQWISESVECECVELEGEAKARYEDLKIFVESCREFGISDEAIIIYSF